MKKIMISALVASSLLLGSASCGVKKEADAAGSASSSQSNVRQERPDIEAAKQLSKPAEIPTIRSDR